MQALYCMVGRWDSNPNLLSVIRRWLTHAVRQFQLTTTAPYHTPLTVFPAIPTDS